MQQYLLNYCIDLYDNLCIKSKKIHYRKKQIKYSKYLKLGSRKKYLDKIPDDITDYIFLKFLDASFNTIKEIDNLKDLIDLQNIDLKYNRIEKIPEKINTLINLKYLNLHNNQIKEIPYNFGITLKNIISLNLDQNKISNIDNLRNIIALKELYLSNNNIKDISSLSILINLHTIFLSKNKINEIPEKIYDLVNLQCFIISHNRLTSLSNNIGNFINMREFSCCDNQIVNLPISIINMRNIMFLDLSNNPIENINPIIERFIDIINERRYFDYAFRNRNIYDDRQNVHVSSIQKSVRNSIINILNFNY